MGFCRCPLAALNKVGGMKPAWSIIQGAAMPLMNSETREILLFAMQEHQLAPESGAQSRAGGLEDGSFMAHRGIGIGLELHRLHRRILEEQTRVRSLGPGRGATRMGERTTAQAMRRTLEVQSEAMQHTIETQGRQVTRLARELRTKPRRSRAEQERRQAKRSE